VLRISVAVRNGGGLPHPFPNGNRVPLDLAAFASGAGFAATGVASAETGVDAWSSEESTARTTMGEGVCRKKKLFTAKGRKELEGLALGPWASYRRQELLRMFDELAAQRQNWMQRWSKRRRIYRWRCG
jgi:hypothetical protein